MSWRHLSISGISQLLLTDVDQTLMVDFWNIFLTDVNNYGDICPVSIVLATFVHIRNISAVTDRIFNQTLMLGSLDHLKQMETITISFIKATCVLATFMDISNISGVTVK